MIHASQAQAGSGLPPEAPAADPRGDAQARRAVRSADRPGRGREAARSVLRAERATVWLLEPDSGMLALTTHLGRAAAARAARAGISA